MAVTNTGGQLHYIPQCLRPSTLQYTHHSYIVGTESGCRSLVGVLYFYYHHMSESRVHCRGTQHCATRQQWFDRGQQVAMAVRSYLKPITGRNTLHSATLYIPCSVLWSPHVVPQQCGRATPAPPTITPTPWWWHLKLDCCSLQGIPVSKAFPKKVFQKSLPHTVVSTNDPTNH